MRLHFLLPALGLLAILPSGALAKCVTNDLGICTTSTISSASTVCVTQTQPVCARQYVQCFTTPCFPIKQTIANFCEMRALGAKFLYTGVCKSDTEWENQVKLLTEKIEARILKQGEHMRLRYAAAMQSLCSFAQTDQCRQVKEVRANILDNRKPELTFEEMQKVFASGRVLRMETQHNGLLYVLLRDGQKFTMSATAQNIEDFKKSCVTCADIPLTTK